MLRVCAVVTSLCPFMILRIDLKHASSNNLNMHQISQYPFQPTFDVLKSEVRKIDQEWDARDVCSSFWRLYVNNRDGAVIHLSNGQHYPLHAKRVYMVPAWVGFTCENVRPLGHFYVHFDLAGLPGALVRQLFPHPIVLPLTRLLSGILRQARAAVLDHQLDPMIQAMQILTLLHHAMGAAWAQLDQPQRADCMLALAGTHVFADILKFIDEHLSEDLNNTRLARQCHLSRDHFVRRFTQQVGQTPAQYVREKRVTRGAQLLHLESMSIESIAQACGFADRFHFSRVFTRIMGAPPAAYRQGKRV